MRNILFWLAMTLFLGSCTINKDILFKTPTDYVYAELSDSMETDSKITPNNILNLNFYTGDGHMLIEGGIGSSVLSSSSSSSNNSRIGGNQVTYLVDKDGTVKFPVLGRVEIAGLSIREAEKMLENRYSHYYNEPFVMLEVNNNRVIVSPGAGGEAKVITLVNANTTLLEALALAGGVDDRGLPAK